MKFVDEAVTEVESGDGGKGCISFRREKFVPRGGPNGGNGGKGGDVIIEADPNLSTLLDFKYRPSYRAGRGGHGGGSDKNGRNAEPLVLRVPPGTVVHDDETGEVLGDLVEAGATLVAARGGRGGRGNAAFKSSSNQAPRKAEPGEPGEARRLRLELKLLADVGLVGLPNAGKSTLISRISAARPKIAEYPFTTLHPNLGVVADGRGGSFVVADLPGLIAGANRGQGLGHQFLRHISRTRALVHLVDWTSEDPAADAETVTEELRAFEPALLEKPGILALTKADLAADEAEIEAVRLGFEKRGERALPVSAVSGRGLDELVGAISDILGVLEEEASDEDEEKVEGWEP